MLKLTNTATPLFFCCLAGFSPTYAAEADLGNLKNTNWSGMYIGLNVGRGSQPYVTECISGTWDCSGIPIANPMLRANGHFHGAHIGYNWNIQKNYILGLEANVFSPHIKGAATFPTVGQYKSSETKYDALKTLQVRAGRDFGQSLLFITGGLAWTKLQTTFINRYDSGGIINYPNGYLNVKNTSMGYVLGIGAEHALTESISFSAELSRARFSPHQFDISTQINGGTAQNWAFEKVNPSLTIFKLAVNYRY